MTTCWFDVAVATSLFMTGHLCFGRFVEHQSRGRRAMKSLLGVSLLVVTSAWFGRGWMFAECGAIVAGVAVVHGWWLPRRGVNGWTAEPRARYNALMGLNQAGKPIDPTR
jgi:hypothetical protein